MIIEINKKLLRDKYNGNIVECVNDGFFIKWTQEHIKACFNFGFGTVDDFNAYKNGNRIYSIFVEV